GTGAPAWRSSAVARRRRSAEGARGRRATREAEVSDAWQTRAMPGKSICPGAAPRRGEHNVGLPAGLLGVVLGAGDEPRLQHVHVLRLGLVRVLRRRHPLALTGQHADDHALGRLAGDDGGAFAAALYQHVEAVGGVARLLRIRVVAFDAMLPPARLDVFAGAPRGA